MLSRFAIRDFIDHLGGQKLKKNCNDENESFVNFLRKISIYWPEKLEEKYLNSHSFVLISSFPITKCAYNIVEYCRLALFSFGFFAPIFPVFDSVVMFQYYGNWIIAASSVFFIMSVAPVPKWVDIDENLASFQTACQVSASISGPGIPNSECYWFDEWQLLFIIRLCNFFCFFWNMSVVLKNNR